MCRSAKKPSVRRWNILNSATASAPSCLSDIASVYCCRSAATKTTTVCAARQSLRTAVCIVLCTCSMLKRTVQLRLSTCCSMSWGMCCTRCPPADAAPFPKAFSIWPNRYSEGSLQRIVTARRSSLRSTSQWGLCRVPHGAHLTRTHRFTRRTSACLSGTCVDYRNNIPFMYV